MKKKIAIILTVILTLLLLACGKKENTEAPDTPNAMIPSIIYNGEIYSTTGKQMPVEVEESAYVGKITSTVPLSEMPTEEGQANFGEIGNPYAVISEGFIVLMNNEWTLFEIQTIESVTVDEIKQALDGYYASCMTGTEKGVISMEVVDEALHIKGTLAYDATDADKAGDKYYKEYYFADKADVVEYIFLLSADTQFIASGGMASEEDAKYERQLFEESHCNKKLDSGLGLHITVENGVVTKIVTAS